MRASRLRRMAGFVVGVVLLLAAVWVAVSRGVSTGGIRGAITGAPPWLVAAALLLPVFNWLIASLSLWVQTSRYGRVGLGEMTMLVGAAWLLNYLPLRPGMFGRIAYHRTVNRIHVGDSVRALVVGMACGAAAVGCALAAAWLTPASAPAGRWVLALAPGPALALTAAVAARGGAVSWLAAIFLVRCADIAIWTLRYWVVFRLVGSPIGPAQAIAVASVSQLALNVPLFGNGLGLREWSVGLAAAHLPEAWMNGVPRATVPAAISADLVNRAIEVAVAVPVGLACSALVLRRSRRRRLNPDETDPRTHP